MKFKHVAMWALGLCAAALVGCGGGSVSFSWGNNRQDQSPPPTSTASLSLLAGAVGEKIDTAAIGRNIFIFPESIAIDARGDALVADAGRFLKVSRGGMVSHFSALEECYSFHGASLDAAGNLYTSCDSAVYRMSPDGVFSLVAGQKGRPGYADGAGVAAAFSFLINDVLTDAAGNVYVADLGNSRVRQISKDGMVTTLAGNGAFESSDGVGVAAAIARPWRLGMDLQGNLLVSDSCALRRITSAGVVTTIAGNAEQCGRVDGIGTAARLMETNGIAVDANGNTYVADHQQVRLLAPGGQVTTLVGATAGLARIQGMALRSDGTLLVVDADSPNRQVRVLTPAGLVSVYAGTESLSVLARPRTPGYVDGSASNARFNSPRGIATDANGNVFVADADNGVVRKVAASGEVTTIAGRQAMGLSAPLATAVDTSGNVFVTANDAKLRRIAPDGAVDEIALPTAPLYPNYERGRLLAISTDRANQVFVAVEVSRQINASCVSTGMTPCQRSYKVVFIARGADGGWTVLANSDQFYRHADGSNSANLILVGGMVVDSSGTLIFSDVSNHTVLGWSAGGARVLVPAQAGLRYPTALQLDDSGNIYLVDNSGLTVRKVTPAGVISTIAGTAGKDELVLGNSPWSLSAVSGLALAGKGRLALSVAHGLIVLELP